MDFIGLGRKMWGYMGFCFGLKLNVILFQCAPDCSLGAMLLTLEMKYFNFVKESPLFHLFTCTMQIIRQYSDNKTYFACLDLQEINIHICKLKAHQKLVYKSEHISIKILNFQKQENMRIKMIFLPFNFNVQPGKKSASRSKSSTPGGKKSGKKRSRSTSPTKQLKSKETIDLHLNPIALTNAYYVTHGVQDGLDKFGYKWEGAKKKKKKKK